VHVDVPNDEREQNTPHIKQLIQPSHTHMDLNIGTAFWFASRGRGYCSDYSSAEIEEHMNIRDEASGRPLLRVGEEDAALSVGLSSWKQEEPAKSKCFGEHLVSIPSKNSDCDGVSNNPNVDAKEYIQNENVCSQLNCRRIAKPSCKYRSCKRCCLSWQKLHYSEAVKCSVHKISLGISESGQSEEAQISSMKAVNNDRSDDVDDEALDSLTSFTNELVPVIKRIEYQSTVKVLLIGIGADEQMAGYGRHRTAFVRGCRGLSSNGVTSPEEHLLKGYDELTRELNKDLQRLWQRNLGRYVN
jgi:hypothetical protein